MTTNELAASDLEYTYQNWVDGNPLPHHVNRYKILRDDQVSVLDLQDKALQFFIEKKIKQDIAHFLYRYNRTYLKKKHIEDAIENMYVALDENLKEQPVIKTYLLNPYYLLFDLTYKETEEISSEGYANSDIYLKKDGIGPAIEYIVGTRYVEWLLWFQQREEDSFNALNERFYSEIIGNWDESIEQHINQGRVKYSWASYNWLHNPDVELEELYQLLKGNALIHSDTTLDQLKAVFTAKPLELIQAIKWNNDNASELLYFILKLQGEDGSIIEKENRTNYQRLTTCFVKPDGKPFTEKFRQAKNNLKRFGLAPSKQQVIDSIVQQFY
jgi:hypothetical protein